MKPISKITINRIKLYKSLCETIKNKDKVYTTAEEIGFIVGETTPYTGEAGYSTRVKVIWKDGSMTKCCIKGMKSYKGGWRIR
jgi:hypothetical protein